MHVVDQLKYQKQHSKRIISDYQEQKKLVQAATLAMNQSENPRWRRIQDKRKLQAHEA